jgi:cell division transport system permease protein
VFAEMWQGLRRNLTMTVATTLTITIALFGLGAAWLFHAQINRTHDYWFGKIEISVFLKQNSTGPEQDAIQQELTSLPQVKQIIFENKHDAWLRFQKQFGKTDAALVKNSSESQMPQSFRVKLKDPKQFNVVAEAVQQMPGVEQVQAEPEALKKLFAFFDTLERTVLLVAFAGLVTAVLLIFNNVRLAAYTRRREVGIMRLVGASDAYIEAPFVLEIQVCAMIATAIATAGLFLVWYIVFQHGIARAFNTNLLDVIGWGEVIKAIPYLVVTAVVAAGVTAVGTLQRYLRV